MKQSLSSLYCCFLLVLFSTLINAQTTNDSTTLLALNQQIDTWVVKADTANLSKAYAADFVFNHGSGRVDNKQSWLVSASKGSFTSRQHDSAKVELHTNLAIIRGKLNVEKKNNTKPDMYYLWYIRVFTNNNHIWQLTSHTTYFEKHL
jgi:hypothetical protein